MTAWVSRAGQPCSGLRTLALHPSYWLAPDLETFVGWVERENFGRRTPLPSARNPCCRNRLFSSRCEAQLAHGRMGFARWAAVFWLKNSRAAPILLAGAGPGNVCRMGGAREFRQKNAIAQRAKPMLLQSVVFQPMRGTIGSWPHGFRALGSRVLA